MSRVLNQVHDQTGASCTDHSQSGNRIQNTLNITSPQSDTDNKNQPLNTMKSAITSLNNPIETDTEDDSFHSTEETPIELQTKNQRRKVATRQTTQGSASRQKAKTKKI